MRSRGGYGWHRGSLQGSTKGSRKRFPPGCRWVGVSARLQTTVVEVEPGGLIGELKSWRLLGDEHKAQKETRKRRQFSQSKVNEFSGDFVANKHDKVIN